MKFDFAFWQVQSELLEKAMYEHDLVLIGKCLMAISDGLVDIVLLLIYLDQLPISWT